MDAFQVYELDNCGGDLSNSPTCLQQEYPNLELDPTSLDVPVAFQNTDMCGTFYVSLINYNTDPGPYFADLVTFTDVNGDTKNAIEYSPQLGDKGTYQLAI